MSSKQTKQEREKEKIESLATNKEKHKYLRKMLPGKHLVTNPFSSNCKKNSNSVKERDCKEKVEVENNP